VTENELSHVVVGCSLKVHSALGPGLLECGYRVDLLVERKLIVEVKGVEALAEIHFAQVLTYLRLSDLRLALLLNFNVVHMKDGIRRIVNNL
jgi:hypothetical protein